MKITNHERIVRKSSIKDSFLMSEDKNHLLLNGYGVYAGTNKMNIF